MSEILKAAAMLDEQGQLSAVDGPVIRAVLAAPAATARQIRSVWALMNGYSEALAQMGMIYEHLVPPAEDDEPVVSGQIVFCWIETPMGRRIAINFPYDERIVETLKGLRRTPASPPWYDASIRMWILPDDLDLYEASRKALEALGMPFGVRVSPELEAEARNAKEAKSRAYESSRAAGADLDVPTRLPLYPFQKAGVRWIEDRRGRALLADDMGVGKTVQTLGYLVRHPIALPALVVCPATLKANWYKETLKFTGLDPLLITSKSSLKAFKRLGIKAALGPEAADVVIMNYDLFETETCRTWIKALKKGDSSGLRNLVAAGRYAYPMLEKAFETVKNPKIKAMFLDVMKAIELQGEKANRRRYVKAAVNGIPMKEFLKGGFRTLICDESHYLKDFRAQRTQAALEMARKIHNVICLTGTPILNRPIELYSQVYVANPKVFPKFTDFVNRYCAPKKTRFGMDYSGSSNLDELEKVLRNEVMIRRTKDQVMPELPKKIRITIHLVLEKGLEEYEREAALSLERLAGIKAERDAWKLLLESKSEHERAKYMADHAQEAALKNRLTSVAINEIEKLKQLAVKAKLPQMAKFIIDAHEQQGKIVVFAAHHETTDRLIEAFAEDGLKVDRIDGRVETASRERIKERFQDGDLEILVCGIRAASEGLTLTASHTVIVGELDWNWGRHLQAEDRIHRWGQISVSTVYYLVAAGTIEENIASMIDAKREVVHVAMGESQRTLDESGILDSILTEILKERRVPS